MARRNARPHCARVPWVRPLLARTHLPRHLESHRPLRMRSRVARRGGGEFLNVAHAPLAPRVASSICLLLREVLIPLGLLLVGLPVPGREIGRPLGEQRLREELGGATASHKRWQSILHLASTRSCSNACRVASRRSSGMVVKGPAPLPKARRTASPDTVGNCMTRSRRAGVQKATTPRRPNGVSPAVRRASSSCAAAFPRTAGTLITEGSRRSGGGIRAASKELRGVREARQGRWCLWYLWLPGPNAGTGMEGKKRWRWQRKCVRARRCATSVLQVCMCARDS